ncbi:MAG: Fpg/Nei family DNA glycosylase [Pseudonocardiales bacterium]|nr:Fpg/Nei family DNA glycosylase [Pseudonocardiales bacterium]
MPEGDTVYLTGKRLNAALAGHRLLRGELRHPSLVEHDLAGRTVLAVRTVGKHLLTQLDDGNTLHSHLRMDGSWHLYRPGDRWREPTHAARVVLATAERVAVGFRLHDLKLVPTAHEHRLVEHLGPDLLDPGWSPEHAAEGLRRLLAQPDTPVGLALLDQRVVAGVGNLYRCEVCFLLGVSPWAPVSALAEPARAIDLSRELLLRNADRPQQSTTGELARGRQTWVYGRGGQPCRRCGTRVIRAEQGEDIYARVVYFCPRCQPAQRTALS